MQIAPGLWQTPDYEPQKGRLHALIVGISVYPQLNTGKNIGIQQLAVSALTAFRFFRWLGTKYRHAVGVDVPMRARLLLSPTQAESDLFDGEGLRYQVGDQVGSTASDPNLWNFHKAVQDWFTDAAAVRDNVADSRTVFFFSGHGLEIGPAGHYQAVLFRRRVSVRCREHVGPRRREGPAVPDSRQHNKSLSLQLCEHP